MWILKVTIYLLGVIASIWLSILYFRQNDDISVSEFIMIIFSSLLSWIAVISLIFDLVNNDKFKDKIIIRKKQNENK